MSLSKDSTVAVITGTTSNLGLNIAYRLLEQLPPQEDVVLVVTSRTLPKVQEAIQAIKKYGKQIHRTGKVEFDYILVDFTDMVSVLAAYYELEQRYRAIHYFFANAAQSTYSGINWTQACVDIASNPVKGVTQAKYKIQKPGVKSTDGLGLVFQANVFGPYYLLHKLQPLLKRGNALVVWISSIMSYPEYLSFDDLQLVRSDIPYDGSKRLVDLLHVYNYRKLRAEGVSQYLVHPGIFTSFGFFQFLNVFTYYGMLMLFYAARLLGSEYHNISGYNAANAPVSCAVSTQGIPQPQDKKIASCTGMSGGEYIKHEEIDVSGAEDAGAYVDALVAEWDEKLKDQITIARKTED